MMMRVWAVVSILCLVAAALLLWRGQKDAAFVLAALGALSWFLDYRSKIRKLLPEDEPTERDESEEIEDEDEDEDETDDEK